MKYIKCQESKRLFISSRPFFHALGCVVSTALVIVPFTIRYVMISNFLFHDISEGIFTLPHEVWRPDDMDVNTRGKSRFFTASPRTAA